MFVRQTVVIYREHYFGNDVSCKWKPWVYCDRVKIAADVEKLKTTLKNRSIKDKGKRTKVTEFIAKRKCRQEFVPPVGELINKAHVGSQSMVTSHVQTLPTKMFTFPQEFLTAIIVIVD